MTDVVSTSPSARARPFGFITMMFACLAGPGLLQIGSDLGADSPSVSLAHLWSRVTDSESAAASGSGQDFEQQLEARSPMVRWARRFYAPVIDEALRRGNHRVQFGRKNWLFYRQAVDYVTGPALDSPRAERLHQIADKSKPPAAVILDFHRQLQAAGVELLVVPVPTKATLYPERLWQGADPWSLPNNPGFGRFVATLEAAGVRVLDLAPVLLDAKRQGHQVFLPRDTHWTPDGMLLAADTVATSVRSLPLWPALQSAAKPFDHRQVAFNGDGDLYNMLAYAPWQRRARPMHVVLTQVIADRHGQGPRSTESPILLLGDSLTNVFSSSELGLGQRGGFAEHLAFRLGLPVDVIAMPAGGASRSRKALALRPQPLKGKRLVIWQFTQRDLMFAAEGWAATPLTPSHAPVEPTGATARRFEVLAWLEDTTRLPRTMDYADCLLVSRYTRVDGHLPTSGDVIAITWGIRDGQPTAAASLRRRAFYRLVLEPLPEEIDLERTCWLDTVGLSSRPWWVVEAERR